MAAIENARLWLKNREPIVKRECIFALIFLSSTVVGAQEHHRHPQQDVPLHEKFYSGWHMPDEPTKSCCNKADCYPTEVRYRAGQLFARRREDGHWLPIPASKIERNRDNPDGRNHLCAPPPGGSHLPNTVFCFALGSGA